VRNTESAIKAAPTVALTAAGTTMAGAVDAAKDGAQNVATAAADVAQSAANTAEAAAETAKAAASDVADTASNSVGNVAAALPKLGS
jgi:hypothetical protein